MPSIAPDPPVVLFDGVCNLCHGMVRFVVLRDRRRLFRFASLQSEAGARLLERCERPPTGVETVVLVTGERCYTRSGAVLRVCRGLGLPWSLLAALLVIPAPLRDMGYRFVTRRRYRWFGRQDSCPVPAPDVADRFLG